MSKTILFEEKYKVNIKDFSTTSEIDEIVEKREGKKLEVVLFGEEIVTKRGDILPPIGIDVDSTIDKVLRKR